MAILASELGKALIEALGLPKHTLSFTLRVRAGAAVRVECEYLPQNSDRLAAALMEYDLVPRSRPVPVAPEHPDFDTWYRHRINVAHAKFMECTSYSLRRDWPTFPPEAIERFFSGPGV